MIIVGIILTVLMLGFLCWVLFQLAVFALPVFAAVTVGLALLHNGAGPMSAIVAAVLAGAATLVAGRITFAHVSSPLMRALVVLLFVAPAVVAGFHAVHGVMGVGTSSEVWRDIFGVIGASVVGGTAFIRLAASARPRYLANRRSPARDDLSVGPTRAPGVRRRVIMFQAVRTAEAVGTRPCRVGAGYGAARNRIIHLTQCS